MTKWQYRLSEHTDYYLAEELAAIGEEGWELVAFDFDNMQGIFKRLKKERRPPIEILAEGEEVKF